MLLIACSFFYKIISFYLYTYKHYIYIWKKKQVMPKITSNPKTEQIGVKGTLLQKKTITDYCKDRKLSVSAFLINSAIEKIMKEMISSNS